MLEFGTLFAFRDVSNPAPTGLGEFDGSLPKGRYDKNCASPACIDDATSDNDEVYDANRWPLPTKERTMSSVDAMEQEVSLSPRLADLLGRLDACISDAQKLIEDTGSDLVLTSKLRQLADVITGPCGCSSTSMSIDADSELESRPMVSHRQRILGTLFGPIGSAFSVDSDRIEFSISAAARRLINQRQRAALEQITDDIRHRVELLDSYGMAHVVHGEPSPEQLQAINNELQRRTAGEILLMPDWNYIEAHVTKSE